MRYTNPPFALTKLDIYKTNADNWQIARTSIDECNASIKYQMTNVCRHDKLKYESLKTLQNNLYPVQDAWPINKYMTKWKVKRETRYSYNFFIFRRRHCYIVRRQPSADWTGRLTRDWKKKIRLTGNNFRTFWCTIIPPELMLIKKVNFTIEALFEAEQYHDLCTIMIPMIDHVMHAIFVALDHAPSWCMTN